MQQALDLVASLPGEIEQAPLSERVMALTRLIDRIVKIDEHNPVEYDEIIRIAHEEEDFLDDDDPQFSSLGRPAEAMDEP
jgi:hypothetical protein